ncbi:hypothetical protein [Pseudomonas sp. H3(2019)]|uniref:hypothetical protein n=1 Tax=Pseudomonas sp. H3(2019) TaxID=2598724 RepID=UPI0011916E7B|nr:hypothetical protein [Pseudomonas sp. H3(2019)]TVT81971.1 hypothetical protein FPT12_17630 [Pseudomonas sp. H3(2019)]
MEFSALIHTMTELYTKIAQSALTLRTSIIASADSAISDEKSAIWATLITDIITIAAALGALALPISLNVIEATRTRYRSPSLLKITPTLSGTDTKKLNRALFLALASSLTAKLLISIHAFNLISLTPYLCLLTAWFGFVMYKVYKHLKFTYTFMSNIETIHNKIYLTISKHANSTFMKKPNKQGFTSSLLFKVKAWFSSPANIQDHITALIELESHLLCTEPTKFDLDKRIRAISYEAIDKLYDNNANEFTRQLLASLPAVMAAVETAREADVYQRIAGYYLSLTMTAILAKEEYLPQLGVIERIARFREDKLPSYGRFCRNGRLFSSFAHKEKSEREVYKQLQQHFSLLIWTSVHEQPENVPELLDNVRQIIQYKGNYNKGGWELPERIAELWGYSSLPEFDHDITEVHAGRMLREELEKKIESKYQPGMKAHLEKNVFPPKILKDEFKNLDIAITELWKGIDLNSFSREIEIETLRALSSLLTRNPEIFIECRELRNPAGARAFNVGHSPVPTSLAECIGVFVSANNFSEFYRSLNEIQEYKIVDAIGALIVYELWNLYILRATGTTIKSEISIPTLPTCHIGELKAANQRVPLLKTALLKILANSRFTDRLGILPEQISTLRDYACQLCELLSKALTDKTKTELATQKLDPASLDRFKTEVTKKLAKSVSTYPLFRRLTIAPVNPITSNIDLPREAFLAKTGTHYIFDIYGPNLAQEVHNWLNLQILLHNKHTKDAENTLPTRNADWIICSSQALSKLEAAGFTTSGRNIIWPDGTGNMRFYEVNCEGTGYYLVLPGESLLIVDYTHMDSGLPISISHSDDGEKVRFTINYYVDAPH